MTSKFIKSLPSEFGPLFDGLYTIWEEPYSFPFSNMNPPFVSSEFGISASGEVKNVGNVSPRSHFRCNPFIVYSSDIEDEEDRLPLTTIMARAKQTSEHVGVPIHSSNGAVRNLAPLRVVPLTSTNFPKTSMTHGHMVDLVEKFNIHGVLEVCLPVDGREATVNIPG
ncbi:hypothetical protein CFOL_v3_06911 [Cephalotus follicularis]|uniref:Uncharacterized protein n=1 Tax=Cephalotus follicularis TaxID=3775 RepID=A0A1Q3B6J6_CEPFO|nr:hypothetical protein CFOL_v3_06911 [Cephalotus follicularis]